MYKVLICEDEMLLRKGLIYSINWDELNCTIVAEAQNGEMGIQMIEEYQPDIIILDINMPIISGLEMLKQTYKKYVYSAIIVSGYSEFSYAQQAMEYNVCDYLLKPIDHEKLTLAIQKAIHRLSMKRTYQRLEQEVKVRKDIELLNIRQTSDTIVQEMLEYVKEHYQDKILMDDIVHVLNYSETLLNRKFKKHTLITFNEYLNRYRIQKAIELMKMKQYTIYEIAEPCGFSNYKYFSTVFHKYIGCSPKEFYNFL